MPKHRAAPAPTKLQRMRAHVFESVFDRLRAEGKSVAAAREVANTIANATVNKHRAKLAKGKKVCKTTRGRKACRTVRGPRLVTRGGTRRQWFPGKKVRGRETFACLEHGLWFETKAGWLSHLRGSAHAGRGAPRCEGCARGRGCDGKKRRSAR